MFDFVQVNSASEVQQFVKSLISLAALVHVIFIGVWVRDFIALIHFGKTIGKTLVTIDHPHWDTLEIDRVATACVVVGVL